MQLGAIVVREFAQAGSLIDQLPLVKESLFNPTVQAIHAGPLREFLPVYYHYLLERVGHLPPFRELQSHELDFLVAQAGECYFVVQMCCSRLALFVLCRNQLD